MEVIMSDLEVPGHCRLSVIASLHAMFAADHGGVQKLQLARIFDDARNSSARAAGLACKPSASLISY